MNHIMFHWTTYRNRTCLQINADTTLFSTREAIWFVLWYNPHCDSYDLRTCITPSLIVTYPIKPPRGIFAQNTQVKKLTQLNNTGRVPFDQKFRFEFPKFPYVKWNGIFHQAGPFSFYSRLSTFSTKNYSTKCCRIVVRCCLKVP